MTTYRRRRLVELKHAYDEARFGADRTLNLRAQLPTAAEAARRADAWLRERQAAGAAEALIITGRGNNSETGFSVVREAVARTCRALKRQGVIDGFTEHSPGSFVATLAPMRRLLEGARRTSERRANEAGTAISGLDPELTALLRALAERSLEALGVRATDAFLEREMASQYAILLRAVPAGDDRDARLREIVRRTLASDDPAER